MNQKFPETEILQNVKVFSNSELIFDQNIIDDEKKWIAISCSANEILLSTDDALSLISHINSAIYKKNESEKLNKSELDKNEFIALCKYYYAKSFTDDGLILSKNEIEFLHVFRSKYGKDCMHIIYKILNRSFNHYYSLDVAKEFILLLENYNIEVAENKTVEFILERKENLTAGEFKSYIGMSWFAFKEPKAKEKLNIIKYIIENTLVLFSEDEKKNYCQECLKKQGDLTEYHDYLTDSGGECHTCGICTDLVNVKIASIVLNSKIDILDYHQIGGIRIYPRKFY